MRRFSKPTPAKKQPNPTTTFGPKTFGGTPVEFEKSVPNSKVHPKVENNLSKPVRKPSGEFSNEKMAKFNANLQAGRTTDSTSKKKQINSSENGKENIQPPTVNRTVSKTFTIHSSSRCNGITPDISHPGRHSSSPITPVPTTTTMDKAKSTTPATATTMDKATATTTTTTMDKDKATATTTTTTMDKAKSTATTTTMDKATTTATTTTMDKAKSTATTTTMDKATTTATTTTMDKAKSTATTTTMDKATTTATTTTMDKAKSTATTTTMDKATTTTTATATATGGGGSREGAWAGKLRPGRGLKNLGNTCFMNCVLQCLSHTLPLREYFVTDSYKQSLRSPKRGSLSAAFAKVLGELWMSYTISVAPYELKSEVGRVAPRFSGYSQHDAQEFMRFLLNEVHEEINRADVKGRQAPGDSETLRDACARYLTWEDSRVSQLFCGMLKSAICCSECKKKSVVYDPYMDLALPIPKSTAALVKDPSFVSSYSLFYQSSAAAPVKLSQCFKQFTDEETLDDGERPYCSKCKQCTKCTKQLTVAKLPDILVIQLKRFSGYSIRSKLSTPVTFEETWTLEDESRVKHLYSLYGIVSHSGGIFGGHYMAYCKYREQWRCFNDSCMSEIRWDYVKSQEAYILFYERAVKDVSHI